MTGIDTSTLTPEQRLILADHASVMRADAAEYIVAVVGNGGLIHLPTLDRIARRPGLTAFRDELLNETDPALYAIALHLADWDTREPAQVGEW